MSMNGYDRPTTPFLDALVAEGYYFERAVAPVPRTTPALASLLTGSYPHTSRVRKLTDPLSPDVVSVAEVFHDLGYQTLAVVTNHVLKKKRGLDRGFDVYNMASDARTARQTRMVALRELERFDPARPLFAWVHFVDPHVPYHPDPTFVAAFDPDYRGRYRFHFGALPRPGSRTTWVDPFPLDLPKRDATHRNPLPERVNEHVRRLYAADIRTLDTEIQGLVGAFRARLGGDLIVIFTADHGESLGEHHFYFDHGDYVYNAGSRIPLAIVVPPSHPARGSGRCGSWVSLVDIVPTLFDLLGREVPPRMAQQLEGRSLAACMTGEDLRAAPVFVESGHSYYPELVSRRVRNDPAGRFRAVIFGDWKLIWTPFQSGDLEWELYNVREDPHETRNVYSPDHAEVPGLKAHLDAWVARQHPAELAAPTPISEDDRETLRELGYIE
jgi:arylsulfatase A-like enzyme